MHRFLVPVHRLVGFSDPGHDVVGVGNHLGAPHTKTDSGR